MHCANCSVTGHDVSDFVHLSPRQVNIITFLCVFHNIFDILLYWLFRLEMKLDLRRFSGVSGLGKVTPSGISVHVRSDAVSASG
jgi:hypothetical protein